MKVISDYKILMIIDIGGPLFSPASSETGIFSEVNQMLKRFIVNWN